eukprot:g9789.t1
MKAAGPGELYGPRIPPPPPALGPGEVHGPCNPPQALNYLNLNKKYEVTNKVVPMGRPHTPFLSWHEESLASVKTIREQFGLNKPKKQSFTPKEDEALHRKRSWKEEPWLGLDGGIDNFRRHHFDSKWVACHKDKLSRVGDAVQTVGKDHQDWEERASDAPRRRDGRRADAFSARRILLERILGEPDFAHYQREGRHELVPVRQIKQVQEDPRAGTPVLIRWDFNNYTLVYGSLSQAEGGNVRASVYDWDTVPAPLACKMALDSQDLRDALRPFLHGKRHALYDPAENREAWKDYSSKRALVEVQRLGLKGGFSPPAPAGYSVDAPDAMAADDLLGQGQYCLVHPNIR